MVFEILQAAPLVLAQASGLPGQSLGVAHFVAGSDWVGKSVFVLLLLMSLASWYLILVKAFAHLRIRRRTRRFLARFWAAASLDQAAAELPVRGAVEPFARLAGCALRAWRRRQHQEAQRLAESGPATEVLTRTIRQAINAETARLESGLTVLASVGSTAPFVGLFGTVWGVYHALIGISLSQGTSIGGVAGPVGEALVMTGLGLVVAIPAVLGYNAFVRLNRVYLARLDAFAHDLFALLAAAQPVAEAGAGEAGPCVIDAQPSEAGQPVSLAARRGV